MHHENISQFNKETFPLQRKMITSLGATGDWSRAIEALNTKIIGLEPMDTTRLTQAYLPLSEIKRWGGNPFIPDAKKDNTATHSLLVAHTLINLFDQLPPTLKNSAATLAVRNRLVQKALVHDLGEYRGELSTIAKDLMGHSIPKAEKKLKERKITEELLDIVSNHDPGWVSRWLTAYDDMPDGFWAKIFKFADRLEAERHSIMMAQDTFNIEKIKKIVTKPTDILPLTSEEAISRFREASLSMCNEPLHGAEKCLSKDISIGKHYLHTHSEELILKMEMLKIVRNATSQFTLLRTIQLPSIKFSPLDFKRPISTTVFDVNNYLDQLGVSEK